MGDVELPKGARARLGRVDGNLRAARDVEIEADGPDGVVVTGSARFEGDAKLHSALTCRHLELGRGHLDALDRLTVENEVDARDASMEVRGLFRAGHVDVGRKLRLHQGGRTGELNVGGVLESPGSLSSEDISVGGLLEAAGRLTAGSVEVGGR